MSKTSSGKSSKVLKANQPKEEKVQNGDFVQTPVSRGVIEKMGDKIRVFEVDTRRTVYYFVKDLKPFTGDGIKLKYDYIDYLHN